MSFTPAAEQVFVLSLQEAAQLGHDDVGSGHILLALIREGSGIAAKVLLQLGAELDGVRRQLIELSAGPDPD